MPFPTAPVIPPPEDTATWVWITGTAVTFAVGVAPIAADDSRKFIFSHLGRVWVFLSVWFSLMGAFAKCYLTHRYVLGNWGKAPDAKAIPNWATEFLAAFVVCIVIFGVLIPIVMAVYRKLGQSDNGPS